jgi:hypothetical protein
MAERTRRSGLSSAIRTRVWGRSWQ